MATDKRVRDFFHEVHAQSNKIIEILLIGYFFFGVCISFFYDTFLVGIGVGALNLILYFGVKLFFRESKINQYVASLVFGIFMAQFIYQMHGLFEMHFTAFIAIIAMLTYQNKYAYIPQALFVVLHHSSFAYIQYLGVVNENVAYQHIYFTQLEFMNMTAFLFHAGLYTFGIILAAIYSHNLEKNTTSSAMNIIKLRESESVMLKNIDIANQMASGNLDIHFDIEEGDVMGGALREMRNNLNQSQIREKEEKFINLGIAELSEIIRANDGNLNELSYQVIAYLVKYLKANQGAIFVHMEDEEGEYLELKGCYAYNRKKFIDKKVGIGEGIVGQCYLEKEYTLLKEIPADYLNITSGLGQATPNFLIVVPVKTEQIIEGVIEIASFKEFKQYQIDFLVKVCENIASVITSAKINAKTKMLFEKSQEQTEMLRAQEEEMRQNMEELSATQEEMQRKTGEFENRFSAIHNSQLGMIEFDTSGTIISVNPAFSNSLGYSKDELIGEHYQQLKKTTKTVDFSSIMSDLKKGNSPHGEFEYVDKRGNRIIQFGTFSTLQDKHGSITGAIHLVMNVSAHSTATRPAVTSKEYSTTPASA